MEILRFKLLVVQTLSHILSIPILDRNKFNNFQFSIGMVRFTTQGMFSINTISGYHKKYFIMGCRHNTTDSFSTNVCEYNTLQKKLNGFHFRRETSKNICTIKINSGLQPFEAEQSIPHTDFIQHEKP